MPVEGQGNAVATALQGIGLTPGVWPKGLTGAKALPFSLGMLGAGGGFLTGQAGGWLAGLEEEQTRKLRNRLAMLGLMAGGAAGLGSAALMSPQEGFGKMWTTTGPYAEYPFMDGDQTFIGRLAEGFIKRFRGQST